MKKLSLISSALLVAASVSFSVPSFAQVTLTDADRARIEERKNRRTTLPGERVGRGVTRAFELYNEEKVDEALKVLLEIRGGNDFDNAFLARFIGNLYAQRDAKQAIRYLEQATKPDVLSFTDQASSLKLVADLQQMEGMHKDAIRNYEAWIRFTGENDPDVYLRIANSYYQLQDYKNVLVPIDNAIRYSRTPNKNHYMLKMGALYESRNYPKTVEVVETMVQLFPEERQFWVYLGNFYTLVEDYQKSLSAFQIAYNNGYLESEAELKMLGQMYANNNIPYKAAAIYEKYLKSGKIKKDRTMLTAIASNFQAAREFAKAAQYYGELAALTNEADAYRRQAMAFMAIQRYNDALKAFEATLARDSSNAGRVHMSMVEAYLNQGKLREAYASLQQAKRDSATARQANSYENYIREKARVKGINL
ncbi:tetratricopeptide repeat protein [Alishewanella sp. BS5-314]|uniref:tetratricopeptide repeat protein n=1 Tax=Alishewanella sp. BS5-314 TaxID=2755587 RepID=UPI0021BA6D13|nr:tetratricopeptide repeat protein [Alishewanella sp. BS5-314]MCT8125602.1 tetratricopeptide repeat protein [Alishewanella sp. BS5-314]